MQEDVANYRQYKMGFSQIIRVAEGALPSKFDCQEIRAGDQKRGSCRKKLANTTMSRKAYIKQLKNDIDQGNRATAGTPVYTQKKGNAMSETIVEITEPLQTQCVKRTSSESIVENQMCRICFTIDCNMYLMTSFKVLNEAYENLTGIMTADEEQLPRYVCTECADRLMNCARFRRRSLQAHSMLLDVARRHGRITVELLQTAKKILNSLNSDAEDQGNVDNLDFDDSDLDKVNKLAYITGDSRREVVDMYVNVKKYKPEIGEAFDRRNNIDDETNTAIDDEHSETNDLNNQDVDACSSHLEIEISAKNDINRDGLSVCSFNIKNETVDDNIEDGVTNRDGNELTSNKSVVCAAGRNDVTVSNVMKTEHIDVAKVGTVKVETPSSDCLECLPSMTADEDVCGDPLRTHEARQEGERGTNTSQHLNEMGIHNQQPPEADCSYQTYIDILLLEHSKAHAYYYCDMCNYKTDRRSKLGCHIRTHLVKDGRSKICNSKKSVQKYMRRLPGEKPYSCDVCKKVFTLKSQLRLHSTIHSGEKPYSCNICKNAFTRKTTLKKHLIKHSDKKPYACHVCKTVFTGENQLRLHSVIHSGGKLYSCDICGKAFIQKDKLQSHLTIQSCTKIYPCDVCEKVFKSKKQHRYHSMLHSGETPYSCNICKKGFRRKDHIQAHLATHSNEKPYTCDICKAGFREKKQLRVHSTIHSGEKPHSCNICNKSFRLNYMLKKHLTTHTGEKPHSCDICQKAFKRKEHLQTHLLIHSDEKPYSCVICKKTFKRKQNLNTHFNSHSGE